MSLKQQTNQAKFILYIIIIILLFESFSHKH